MTNWKTTLSGIATIFGALTDIVHSLAVGTPINWNADIPLILTGIGLLAAKDSTTHSTLGQVAVATEKAVPLASDSSNVTAIKKP